MGKGRKKRNEIWKHYDTASDKSVICKHCNHKYKVQNVNKMAGHLLTCDKCPTNVKTELKKTKEEKVNKTLNAVTIEKVVLENSQQSLDHMIPTSSSTASSNTNQPSTSTSLSPEEEKLKNLSVKFAKALFVSGSPLSLVEHPLWIDFFKDLQPSFQLPSRKNLSISLLNKVHFEIRNDVTEKLKSTSYLHLQCDGWTNVNNEGIINFIISNPEPYFVKSLDTEDNSHTSVYISEEIIKIMKVYGETKFVSLIGDNAKNLQKSFQLVKNKYPHIIPLNCAAHSLNLLVNDILKCESVRAIIDLANDVIKAIKKSQLLSSLLNKIIKEKKTGETLKLPVKTRWGSQVAALKSLKNTKSALLTLAVHERASMMHSHTKTTLLDDTFWHLIDECIKLLEPITVPIFQLESNECNIHHTFLIFKDIMSKLEFILPASRIMNEDDKVAVLTATEKRTKDCIKPIHLAAYLLDPNTQGLILNEDEDLEAMEFIEQMSLLLDIDILPDLASYKARDGFWSKRFLWEKVNEINPVSWWKGLCSTKKLSKVAVRILTTPCTSAATERSFSKHGHIHSHKRNRLTPDRAAKLTYVSYNWDLLHKHEYDEREESEENESLTLADQQSDFVSEVECCDSDSLQDSQNNICSERSAVPRGYDIEFLNCGNVVNSDEDFITSETDQS